MLNVTPLPLLLKRTKQLPQRAAETWQGGIFKLPMWIGDPDGPGAPQRVVGAVWLSSRTGLIHVEPAGEQVVPDAELVLRAFAEFGRMWGKHLDGRPARVEMRDPQLAAAVRPALAGLDTPVDVVPDLPGVTAVLRNLEKESQHGVRHPGLLETKGVTAQRVAAFAEAAAAFYRARPWDQLANEDVIVVEAPASPRGLSVFAVMGRGGQEFGLSFHSSRRAFERVVHGTAPAAIERVKGVTFGPAHEMPYADLDAWEDHGWPVAEGEGYPVPGELFADGRFIRPTATELTHIELLLRALAETTEDDLDAGRWQRRVTTFGGPVDVTLCLPELLEAEALGPKAPAGRRLTPLEQAQELANHAAEATGRRRITLARQALAISADCADAWVELGEAAGSPEAAREQYVRGLEAATRAIGDAFESLVGRFWIDPATRPYMRARMALAGVLQALGHEEEAASHFREMLRLNPNDNQGVRHVLLPWLLERGKDDEAGPLLEHYPGDVFAIWPYGRALWLFRREGDSPAARAALAHARDVNPHVLGYLVKPDSMPDLAPSYTLGSREEAAHVTMDLLGAVLATDGAMAWIRRSAWRTLAKPRQPPRAPRRRR